MVRVSTHPYVYEHGKEPRGVGWWAFDIGGVTYWFPRMESNERAMEFSEAKKQAKAFAADLGYRAISVLP